MIPLWVRPRSYPRWCRLTGIGVLSMMTACHAPIEAREHVQLDHEPPECDRCTACLRELSRRPSTAVLFDVVDLDSSSYEQLEIDTGRVPTIDLREPATVNVDAVEDWRDM